MKKYQIKKITILGAGAWGTALAHLFSSVSETVCLWAHEKNVVDSINQKHSNDQYLVGYKLEKNIVATSNIQDACFNTQMFVEAVPMVHLASVMKTIDQSYFSKIPFLITSKGVYSEDLLLPTELLQTFGIALNQMVVAVGPTFAKEIMQGDVSGFCVASQNINYAQFVGNLLDRKHIATTYSDDLVGAQIGGVLKNIIALGVGMLMGAGAGENLRALALVTGFQELHAYGLRKGAKSETLIGVAGLGDMLLTSLSRTSKNYKAGFMVGEGRRDAVKDSFTALPEGCNTVKLYFENDIFFQTNMPFCSAVYRVFWAGEDPSILVTVLRAERE
ncbi:NAD(P)H-dependent glycerol-3-phosphate dehydrogenase [Candidatus Babeliales bacterium]|nr:NAD(P)H-dependent glycerol-3-phosphate dehydrogenase [Candidatus Babeliales bacterium]